MYTLMYMTFIIAYNTFFEMIRNRILYGLIFFAILLIGFSVALGELSFAEQNRIIANTGLTSIHLVMVVICIFIGSSILSKEFEKLTYMTILSRSVSRSQFIAGKFFGLLSIVILVNLGFLLILGFMLWGTELFNIPSFFIIYLGYILEASVLIAMVLFLSIILQPFITVTSGMGMFLIGHWLSDLQFFADKSQSVIFKYFADFIYYIIPNLEKFNWRSSIHGYSQVEIKEILLSVQFSLGWSMFFLLMAMIFINKKDLV